MICIHMHTGKHINKTAVEGGVRGVLRYRSISCLICRYIYIYDLYI